MVNRGDKETLEVIKGYIDGYFKEVVDKLYRDIAQYMDGLFADAIENGQINRSSGSQEVKQDRLNEVMELLDAGLNQQYKELIGLQRHTLSSLGTIERVLELMAERLIISQSASHTESQFRTTNIIEKLEKLERLNNPFMELTRPLPVIKDRINGSNSNNGINSQNSNRGNERVYEEIKDPFSEELPSQGEMNPESNQEIISTYSWGSGVDPRYYQKGFPDNRSNGFS